MKRLAVLAVLAFLAACNADNESNSGEQTVGEEASILNMGSTKTLTSAPVSANPGETEPSPVAPMPMEDEVEDETMAPDEPSAESKSPAHASSSGTETTERSLEEPKPAVESESPAHASSSGTEATERSLEEPKASRKEDRAAKPKGVNAEPKDRGASRKKFSVEDGVDAEPEIRNAIRKKVSVPSLSSSKVSSTIEASKIIAKPVKEQSSIFSGLTAGSAVFQKLCTPTIKTVAGNGKEGFSGDGGPATSASLCFHKPQNSRRTYQIALDSTDNLYIPDACNNRVRRVGFNGHIETAVGNGTHGISDGVGWTSGDGGSPKNASIAGVRSIAFDQNFHLYVGHYTAVRKVDGLGYLFEESDPVITTYAGCGNCSWVTTQKNGTFPAKSFSVGSSNSLALDQHNNLFLSEREFTAGDEISSGAAVYKVDTNGVMTRIAGSDATGFSGDGGPAKNASLSHPIGLAFDKDGNLYIADNGNDKIRKVHAVNGVVTPDSIISTVADVTDPKGLASDKYGNIFIASGGVILKMNSQGQTTIVAGSGGEDTDGIPAKNALLKGPMGIAFDSTGDLYIQEYDGNRVRKVDMDCSDQNPEEVETPK